MRQNLIQTARARQLRREQTPGEKALWKMLRARRLGGLKVRRQVPLGPWIADFYCADLKLVIETETGPRDQPDVDADADVDRDSWMRGEGITVLRLRTRDILNDPAGCAALIHQMARELTG